MPPEAGEGTVSARRQWCWQWTGTAWRQPWWHQRQGRAKRGLPAGGCWWYQQWGGECLQVAVVANFRRWHSPSPTFLTFEILVSAEFLGLSRDLCVTRTLSALITQPSAVFPVSSRRWTFLVIACYMKSASLCYWHLPKVGCCDLCSRVVFPLKG